MKLRKLSVTFSTFLQSCKETYSVADKARLTLISDNNDLKLIKRYIGTYCMLNTTMQQYNREQ
jgi:hypothetical protein